MSQFDASKFTWHELITNHNGKQSGSGFIGVLMGILTIASFSVAMLGWWLGKPDILDIFDKILQLGLLSAALLGIRKVSGSLGTNKGKTSVEGASEEDDKQPG